MFIKYVNAICMIDSRSNYANFELLVYLYCLYLQYLCFQVRPNAIGGRQVAMFPQEMWYVNNRVVDGLDRTKNFAETSVRIMILYTYSNCIWLPYCLSILGCDWHLASGIFEVRARVEQSVDVSNGHRRCSIYFSLSLINSSLLYGDLWVCECKCAQQRLPKSSCIWNRVTALSIIIHRHRRLTFRHYKWIIRHYGSWPTDNDLFGTVAMLHRSKLCAMFRLGIPIRQWLHHRTFRSIRQQLRRWLDCRVFAMHCSQSDDAAVR
jgi:hypothetical protein